MAGTKDRSWTWDEQTLAIWRFRNMGKGYGVLPLTLRELAHLFDTREDQVRKLFHRINYLERIAPSPDGYRNGPRQYDLRAVWEHYRDQADRLGPDAELIQQRLLAERGPVPVRKPIEFSKRRPTRK
jgi:hypothetical protein